MDTKEVLFITFREDLKRFIDKWSTVFSIVGYSNVPTIDANSMIKLEKAFEYVDYKIPCENKEWFKWINN